MDVSERTAQTYEAAAENAAAWIGRTVGQAPEVALILGSGLGDFADAIAQPTAFETAMIPGYPVSTVEGHRGRIVFGQVSGRRVMAFQGRIHFYESGDLEKTLAPVRLAHALGARILVVTNAAGGISPHLDPGDLMVISDLINLTGERIPGFAQGPVPGTSIFDRTLREKVTAAADRHHIRVRSGVYAGVKGPSYETAAEVEMIRRLGGDAVGMSTVLEAALGAFLSMRLVGISCITNKATGIGTNPLSHREVNEVAGRVRHAFTLLLRSVIGEL